MSNSEQLLLPFAPTNVTHANRDWLGLQIDHRQFLNALQDEWLCPLPEHHVGEYLAIGSFAEEPKGRSQQPTNLIKVSLQFETRLLPKLTIYAWSAGVWNQAAVDSLPSDVEFVFVPGAIPIFAVTRIVVGSAEERARLLGFNVRNVSNLSMPDVAVDVDEARILQSGATDEPNVDAKGITFPEDYGPVRGSVTMAVWAVPRVDPWFDHSRCK